MHLGAALIILGLHPFPEGVDAIPLLVAIASGLVRSVGVVLMFQVMRSEEVSRVIPVINIFPIFVAILAVPLLGETLGYLQWLAILMTVAGAVFISIRRGAEGGRVRLHKSFLLLLAASLSMGLANIASKYALNYISFWNMYSINDICVSGVFILLAVRPRIIKEIKEMSSRNHILALLTFDEGLVIIGLVLGFWAMQQGPISLVSTILSVRPFFVFIYALALSRLFPAVLGEHFSRGIIMVKIVSIALVVGGVTLLTLAS